MPRSSCSPAGVVEAGAPCPSLRCVPAWGGLRGLLLVWCAAALAPPWPVSAGHGWSLAVGAEAGAPCPPSLCRRLAAADPHSCPACCSAALAPPWAAAAVGRGWLPAVAALVAVVVGGRVGLLSERIAPLLLCPPWFLVLVRW